MPPLTADQLCAEIRTKIETILPHARDLQSLIAQLSSRLEAMKAVDPNFYAEAIVSLTQVLLNAINELSKGKDNS